MVWHGEEEERHNEWQGIMVWHGEEEERHNGLAWIYLEKKIENVVKNCGSATSDSNQCGARYFGVSNFTPIQ